MSHLGLRRGFALRSLAFGSGVALATAALGCAPAQDDVTDGDVDTAQSAIDEQATITFRADQSIATTGALVRSKSVRIVYDADRLTACRGDSNGRPAWSITGFYRSNGGPIHTLEAGGLSPSSGTQQPVIQLDAAGDLEMWFQNTSRWGCNAYDSDFGRNFHFTVAAAPNDPGWVGNLRYVISRACSLARDCDSEMRNYAGDITFDSWTRSRAAVQSLLFDVWKEGVTDWDNPDLWKQLDVQVHWRINGTEDFKSAYVSFAKRAGNNARFELPMRTMDPIPGYWTIQNAADCPAFPIVVANEGNGSMVEVDVDYYFTVNGDELRPQPEQLYRLRFQNYKDLFGPCVSP